MALERVQCFAPRWYWDGLSANHSIPFEVVRASATDLPWNLYHLSTHPDIETSDLTDVFRNISSTHWGAWMKLNQHPCITLEFVIDNLDVFPWCWDSLSENPSITFDHIESHMDKPWNWWILSKHPSLTFEVVLRHMDKPWNWYEISRHPNISWNMIESNLEILPWKWSGITMNPSVTWKEVLKYSKCPWLWYALCANTNPLAFHDMPSDLFKNIHHHCDLSRISMHPSFDLQQILLQANRIPFDWTCVSQHPQLRIEEVLRYPELPWDWSMISQHSNITLEHFKQYPTLPWNSTSLSRNPDLHIKHVLEYNDVSWNWMHVSQHANIPFETLRNNFTLQSRVHWTRLSMNPSVFRTQRESLSSRSMMLPCQGKSWTSRFSKHTIPMFL